MSVTRWVGVSGVALLVVASGQSCAAPSAKWKHDHRREIWHPVAPSADSIELSEVAPPARRSTVFGTYGDAAIARARAQRRDASVAAEDAPPYPCDPRVAGARGYGCANVPGRIGYGQGYAFTPAYVSSPQIVGRDPTAQTSILPPVTGLLWALNGLRFDPH